LAKKPPRKIHVTREEYEAEEAELEALRDRLAELEAEISRIRTERYDPLWRENERLTRLISYWQTRVYSLEARLAELRRIGWPRLRAAERAEYLRIRDVELPKARERLTDLRETQDMIISELWKVLEELTPKRVEADLLKREIAKIQREIARKVIVVKKVEVCAYVNYIPGTFGGSKKPPSGGKQFEYKCALPDVLVSTYVPKPIKDVQVGDMILGEDGHYHRVTHKFERDFNGQIIKLYVRGIKGLSPLKFTPEHPVLVKGKGWVKAEELKVGDILLCPIPKSEDVGFIENPFLTKYNKAYNIAMKLFREKGFRSKRIGRELLKQGLKVNAREIRRWTNEGVKPSFSNFPERIRLTPEMLRLLGYYVAEGYLERNGKKLNGFGFVFGLDEKTYVNDARNLLEQLFGLNPKIEILHNKAFQIRCFSRLFARLLLKWFGEHSSDKHLPEWLMKLPPRKLKHFLLAYIRGDGCIGYNRGSPFIQISTTSKVLAYQLFLLLLKFGVVPNLWTNKNEKGYGRKGGKIYVVKVHGLNAVKLAKAIGIPVKEYKPKIPVHFNTVENNYLLVRVEKIEREHYNGKVYNLETESGTFASPVIVHNCFRLVREEEAETEEMKSDTISLWFDIFFWFKGVPVEVIYGRTNREFDVPEEEEEAAQAYCLAQKIETKTRRIVAQRAGTIERARLDGWDGLTAFEVPLYYGGVPSTELYPEGAPEREKKEGE